MFLLSVCVAAVPGRRAVCRARVWLSQRRHATACHEEERRCWSSAGRSSSSAPLGGDTFQPRSGRISVQEVALRGRGLILITLCLAALIINLDTTIVNVALPALVRQTGATTTDLQWIVDAYNLTFAALLLAAGSLSDRL